MREGGNETIYNPGLLQSTMGALLICHTLGRSNAFHLPVVENNQHFSSFLSGIDFVVCRQMDKFFMSRMGHKKFVHLSTNYKILVIFRKM